MFGQKTLVLGMPKSGTSVLTYRIAQGEPSARICFEPGGAQGQNSISEHKRIARKFGRVVAKTVVQPRRPHELESIVGLYDRVVWIVRDPRDQLISAFFYRWFKNHHPSAEAFARALQRTQRKEAKPEAMPFHRLEGRADATSWAKNSYEPLLGLLQRLRASIQLFHYEDLIREDFQALEEYLGVRVNAAAQVDASLARVARSRRFDNWRDWFTTADEAFYRPVLQPILEQLGYCGDDWTLNQNVVLNPEEGSEYMKRLFEGAS